MQIKNKTKKQKQKQNKTTVVPNDEEGFEDFKWWSTNFVREFILEINANKRQSFSLKIDHE